MWKILGCLCMLLGSAGVLNSWIIEQKRKEKRLEEFVLFIQKSIFALETEKVKVIPYFASYKGEEVLMQVLHKLSQQLAENRYPKGDEVWRNVFLAEEKKFNFDTEIFQIVINVGRGFFGRGREENIAYLKKYLDELERQQVILHEKEAQRRKIWVPVGMLGTTMVMILFL